jgi:endogenous inhibitor of DNA gyrase (YacG/DUF329 family)
MAKCPNCSKAAVKRHRPFCSERCANADLARWLDGRYRIPTDEAPMVYEGNPDAAHEEEG